MGETPQLFPALWGQWGFYFIGGKLQTARELGEQLLSIAQSTQDPALLVEGHHALWPALFFLGEFALIRAHLERGIALYDSQQHGSRAFFYGGHDPGGCCQDFWALTLYSLGYPDQALKKVDEGLTLAQELSHPLSLAVALYYAARLHQARRERQESNLACGCLRQRLSEWRRRRRRSSAGSSCRNLCGERRSSPLPIP